MTRDQQLLPAVEFFQISHDKWISRQSATVETAVHFAFAFGKGNLIGIAVTPAVGPDLTGTAYADQDQFVVVADESLSVRAFDLFAIIEKMQSGGVFLLIP